MEEIDNEILEYLQERAEDLDDLPSFPSGTTSEGEGESLYSWTQTRAAELSALYASRDRGENPFTHVTTGLTSLDNAGLFEPGILTAVGAHPGDGKTAFALQCIEGAARANHHVMGYFFEDPRSFLADRKLASSANVSSFALRRGKLSLSAEELDDKMSAAVDSMAWAKKVSMFDAKLTTSQLRESIKRNIREDTREIVIDYAQAFDAEQDEKSVERVIARLAWDLNALAAEYNVAVVLMSQVKKEVADRGHKRFASRQFESKGGPVDETFVEGFRPGANDMQWSTALQQRAKQVVYLFRPGLWLRAVGVGDAKDNIMEITLDKGNYGPAQAVIRLRWDGRQSRISEITNEW